MITSASSGYDSIRTLRMAGYGLLLLGPSQHLWFNLLSKALPKRDMLTTFKKMSMGQAVYGPVSTTVFFSYNAALQGESGEEIVARLKRDLLPTLINGAMFWSICDFVTYKFVPVHLQFMCLPMDNLFDVHGKLKQSEHRIVRVLSLSLEVFIIELLKLTIKGKATFRIEYFQ
ncbi:hypothetical protein CRYUN_Cryun27aG0076300 [Craigia yunnanensis]